MTRTRDRSATQRSAVFASSSAWLEPSTTAPTPLGQVPTSYQVIEFKSSAAVRVVAGLTEQAYRDAVAAFAATRIQELVHRDLATGSLLQLDAQPSRSVGPTSAALSSWRSHICRLLESEFRSVDALIESAAEPDVLGIGDPTRHRVAAEWQQSVRVKSARDDAESQGEFYDWLNDEN